LTFLFILCYPFLKGGGGGNMSKSMRLRLLLVLLGVFLCGCATIIHGTTQKIHVSSEPSGADVQEDSIKLGQTPVSVTLKRKSDHVLIISKKGYQTEQRVIMHVIHGAVAGNIIVGGLIGWGVDAVSGGQYRLVPEMVHVVLKPLEPGSEEAGSPLLKMTTKQKLEELKKLKDEGLITETEYEAIRKIILKTAVE